MGYVVRMPKLGLEMEEGTVIEWKAAVDEAVESGETIAVIESEKTTADVDARESGVLRTRYVAEGETVEPGTPMGIIAAPDEPLDDLEAEAEADLSGDDSTTSEAADADEGEATAAGDDSTSEAAAVDAPASPRARNRAAELGVDLSTIEGTGPQGAITADDVEAAAESAGGLTVRSEAELDSFRRTIADRLGTSYDQAIHVPVHRSMDAEALLAAVDAVDADVTLTDLLLAALSATLEEHPAFNATFEDGVHRVYEEHNVGLATDTDRGLVTPVLRDVGSMSLPEVAAERTRLVERVQADEFEMADLQDGTITVTNLGPFGVESFTPIINPPQVAILGVNALEERVVPVDGDVETRRFLPIDLVFDHRVVDGADAARFLATLASHLESPASLLPEGVSLPTGESAGVRLPERSVRAHLGEGYAGTVDAGSFAWAFDEPTDVGGTGGAPSPVDLFLGGLSACLSASIRFQAGKRELPIDGITVAVDGRPDRGSLEAIDVDVRLDAPADVDDDTLDRVVEFGERGCHVAETLREDLPVELTWQREN